MFSPYYAWSGRDAPENHCAVNVALYRPGGNLWAMTERGRRDLARSEDALEIGPSRASWRNGALTITIDEWSAPLPRRLHGHITLRPTHLLDQAYDLDGAGLHHWQPIAPNVDIEAEFSEPRMKWRGRAYLDRNWGAEPPELAFSAWDWSRAHFNDGRSILHYDIITRGGAARTLSLLHDGGRSASHLDDIPPPTALPLTFWRMPRHVRGGDAPARLVRTLEDTPFYSRSWLRTTLGGAEAELFHESLSLDRLRSPVVRAMLPFRMPRFTR